MTTASRRIQRLLVANRGEIACRVIHSARSMGIATIAVYSDADRSALHVALADQAVRIGEAAAQLSYLKPEAVLEAARQSRADAIHPGYGFLSENADFAQAVCDAGLIFVGPTPSAIAAMGSKARAKALMAAAGVPLLPGYHGDRQDPDWLKAQAEAITYPVLIKATAGGGGKGMRRVDRAVDFLPALASCQREAASSFGDAQVLIERYMLEPRHIEVQIFGDQYGRVVSLLERDCSLQRRHQKVIEEAPAPGWSTQAREALSAAAVAAARAVNYQNAGTVEFIVDAQGAFYFMEMNTRLQVEHPVTEMILGEDLVAWQLRVAQGEPLPLHWDRLHAQGHAIELRLYAENPERGFLPSTGQVQVLEFPDPHSAFSTDCALRIDSGIREGDRVGAEYDPMLAKIIAHGPSREEALARMELALAKTRVIGPANNLAFLQHLLRHPRVQAGQVSTNLIESSIEQLISPPPLEDRLAALLAVAAAQRIAIRNSRPELDGWRHAGLRQADPASLWLHLRPGTDPHAAPIAVQLRWSGPGLAKIDVDGQCWSLDHGVLEGTWLSAQFSQVLGSDPTRPAASQASTSENGAVADEAAVRDTGAPTTWHLRADIRWVEAPLGGRLGRAVHVYLPHASLHFSRVDEVRSQWDTEAGEGTLCAPMPGKIIALKVAEGDTVESGQILLVMEAMKMEHSVCAPYAARVALLPFALGDQVSEAAVVVHLDPLDEDEATASITNPEVEG